jgi:hypothetical protein
MLVTKSAKYRWINLSACLLNQQQITQLPSMIFHYFLPSLLQGRLSVDAGCEQIW